MQKNWVGVLFFLIISIFVLPFSIQAQVKSTKATSASKNKKESVKKDPQLQKMIKILAQADAVVREAWWVITSEKKTSMKSPFGKIQRALIYEQGGKLTKMAGFDCDRYSLRKQGATGKFPLFMQIYDSCKEKQQMSAFATLDARSVQEMKILFYPLYLPDVLGVASSIYNKTISCDLKGNDQAELLSLVCTLWQQDKNFHQIVLLDKLEYQKGKGDLLIMKGQILENMSPLKKIDVNVPLAGKIVVVEEEIPQPQMRPPPLVKSVPPPRSTPDLQAVPHSQTQEEFAEQQQQGNPAEVPQGLAPPPAAGGTRSGATSRMPTHPVPLAEPEYNPPDANFPKTGNERQENQTEQPLASPEENYAPYER